MASKGQFHIQNISKGTMLLTKKHSMMLEEKTQFGV